MAVTKGAEKGSLITHDTQLPLRQGDANVNYLSPSKSGSSGSNAGKDE